VGICLDSANAYGLVDHGPPADDVEKAQQFKKLWGQKAELRRFKDGSILQAAVWENLKDKRHLIAQYSAAYLLKMHFGISASTFSYYAAQFDSLLVDPSLTKSADSFTKPIHAFEQFLKQLKVTSFSL
jgi:U3 small nucleolar RNA-associated protein 22